MKSAPAKRTNRKDDGTRRAGASDVFVFVALGVDFEDVELAPRVVDMRVETAELVDIEGVARLLYDPVNEYVIIDVVATLSLDALRILDGTAIVAVSLATGDEKSPLMSARL